MKTQTRDNAIKRAEQTIRVLIVVVLALSIALVVLAGVATYGLLSKFTLYVPTMTSESYSQSRINLSPVYLSNIAQDVMQLRLTVNPQTVVNRYQRILSMVEPKLRHGIAKAFNAEIASIQAHKMQSVFYARENTQVDMSDLTVKVTGRLVRIDAGVLLKEAIKTYQIQFINHLGTLTIASIEEVKDHA